MKKAKKASNRKRLAVLARGKQIRKPPRKTNPDWFMQAFHDAGLNLRTFAEQLSLRFGQYGRDKAQVSKIINGKVDHKGSQYNLKAGENKAWGAVLGKDADEIMRQLGYPIAYEPAAGAVLNGVVEERGVVRRLPPNRMEMVMRPPGESNQAIIDRKRGWTFYYRPAGGLIQKHAGKLCLVVTTANLRILGILVDEKTVQPYNDGKPYTGLEIEWAAPVEWIKT